MEHPDDTPARDGNTAGRYRWVPNPDPPLGWWAAWRANLPMTTTMAAGLAVIMGVRHGAQEALTAAVIAFALSLVLSPMGYYIARPKRVWVRDEEP